MLTNRAPVAAAAALIAALVAGCSSGGEGKLYPVSGKVTFNGEPVKEGRVTFKMAGPNGRGYSGAITDGNYSLKSEAGSAKVEIIASRVIPGKFVKGENGEKEPIPAAEMYIPTKYNSATTLTVQVEPKSNDIPFELTK